MTKNIRELTLSEVNAVSGGSMVSDFRENVEDAWDWGSDIGTFIYDSLDSDTQDAIGGTLHQMGEQTWEDVWDYWS